MRSMLLCLRTAEGLVRPTLPTVADAIAEQLGVIPLTGWDQIGVIDSLPAGTQVQTPRPIFPRLDLSKKESQPAMESPTAANPPTSTTPVPSPAAVTPPAPVEEIGIEDFMKVQLRIGRVLEAEPVPKSDKLMKLQVVIGEDRRQIVAGIQKNYSPEDLIGRQVVVCTNLKPAKLRGVESQGMLLAATDAEGGAILLEPDKEAPEGTNVK
jgi:methionyl-tRNA synthetase